MKNRIGSDIILFESNNIDFEVGYIGGKCVNLF